MVSINRLPPTVISNNRKVNNRKVNKKEPIKESNTTHNASKAALVTSASEASHSVQHLSEYDQTQLQYDLPEGHSRKALEQYMSVMNQTKREELTQLLGVDMYI